MYARIEKKGAALLDAALDVLVPSSASLSDGDALDGLVAVNTIAEARRELVKVPMAVARGLDDAALQRSHDGEAYLLFDSSATNGNVCEPVSVGDAALVASGSSARGQFRDQILKVGDLH